MGLGMPAPRVNSPSTNDASVRYASAPRDCDDHMRRSWWTAQHASLQSHTRISERPIEQYRIINTSLLSTFRVHSNITSAFDVVQYSSTRRAAQRGPDLDPAEMGGDRV